MKTIVKTTIILTHFLCIGLPIVGNTQPSTTATPSPSTVLSPSLAEVLGPKNELLRLAIQAAEQLFQTSPSLSNRSSLVQTYERAALTLCFSRDGDWLKMPKSNLLSSVGCSTALSRLNGVDIDNPIAVCIQEGLDSRRCRELFAAQDSTAEAQDGSSGEFNSGALDDIELQLNQAPSAGRIGKIIAEISNLTYNWADETDHSEIAPQVEKLLRDGLSLACSSRRLVLETDQLELTQTPTPQATTTQSLTEGEGGFGSLLATPSSSPMPNNGDGLAPEHFNHTRVLSPRCLELLTTAQQLNLLLTEAICAKDGLFSPRCLDAHRAQNRKNRGPNTHQSNEAFTTF